MLAQADVDAFMDADKVAPDRGPFRWDIRHTWAHARYPVELRAAQVGEVICVASIETPRHWTFNLTYHGFEVYRLDVRPVGRHVNPASCPPKFSNFLRNVRERVHEHVYVEGLDLRCARPLPDQTVLRHAQMFSVFCQRTGLTFDGRYEPPPVVQPRLDLR